MKIFALASLLVVTTCAWSQTSFNPERKYAEGSSTSYKFSIDVKASLGEVNLVADIKMAVKKVFPNGDADIETAVSNSMLTVNGEEKGAHPQPSTAAKFDRFGLPITKPESADKSGEGGPRNQLNFLRFGMYFGEKPLNVGDTYTFDRQEKDDSGLHAKGTDKLLGIENGKARFQIAVDVTNATSEKPMHMDATAIVDCATGKIVKLEGKLKDMPLGSQDDALATADFSLTQKEKQ